LAASIEAWRARPGGSEHRRRETASKAIAAAAYAADLIALACALSG